MTVAPYGTWESPISAEMVTRAGIRWADSIEADGNGLALTRKVLTDYGNDPGNWIAALASPGN